jgi:hypothetical protein
LNVLFIEIASKTAFVSLSKLLIREWHLSGQYDKSFLEMVLLLFRVIVKFFVFEKGEIGEFLCKCCEKEIGGTNG